MEDSFQEIKDDGACLPCGLELKTIGSKKYIEECKRTESTEMFSSYAREREFERLIHCALGITTEASEFADIIKKAVFYGKEIDIEHLKKELGDSLWYIAIACDVIGTDFEELMALNIEKLKARYPEKWTAENAINRKQDDL